MTLLYLDSFSHYDTAELLTLTKWDAYVGTPTIAAGAGPYGDDCLYLDTHADSVTKSNLGNSTIIYGFKCKFVTFPTAPDIADLLIGYDAVGYQHFEVAINNVGQILAYIHDSSGPPAGVSSVPLNANQWNFVEIKWKIHDTQGTIDIYIDGLNVLSMNLLDTKTGTGLANLDSFKFVKSNNACSLYIADLYVADNLGTYNNTVLGEHRVECIFPSGKGSTDAFTPDPAVENYLNVDEATPDGDTTYNYSANAGDTDTFVHDDLVVATGVVAGIQHCLYARKDDVDDVIMQPVVRGAADNPGSDIGLSDDYDYHLQISESFTETGFPYTIAEINANEFGYKVKT